MRRTVNKPFRNIAATAVVAVTLALSAGCGAATASHSSAHSDDAGTKADGQAMSMTPEEMAAMGTQDKGPSSSATMICSEEIAKSVQKTFGLASRPVGAHHWSPGDRLYSCSYPVGGGHLVLSVQDATGVMAGKAHFAMMRRTLSGAAPLTGMEALGFPALSTGAGDVLFLKDGKTLRVDPSRVPAGALPSGISREDAAYGVAAGVVACWKE
jgi:hypothetical protein